MEVELKNGVVVTGRLEFIDHYMNMRLLPDEHQLAKLPPQFAGMTEGILLRSSYIRAVYMPKIQSELEIMEAECRKG